MGIFSSFERFHFLIRQITVRDCIDLILVWAVVYRALLLTKKSGAVQILSGMGVLAIAYFISIWQQLVTFNWLLELFFSNLFLIVVILFQGEIRRALAQIGSNPFLLGSASLEVRYNIEEVAQAAAQLAKKGYGALFVMERFFVVDYFVEQGTEIDAAISAEVLNSIFAPTSPLHDGAVIIRNGRIFSAGNFLPLSKNPVNDKNMGTRHRAAFGLAEQTDAIIVLVSEENRTINVVQGEQYKNKLDQAGLRKYLYDELGVKGKVEWSPAS